MYPTRNIDLVLSITLPPSLLYMMLESSTEEYSIEACFFNTWFVAANFINDLDDWSALDFGNKHNPYAMLDKESNKLQ